MESQTSTTKKKPITQKRSSDVLGTPSASFMPRVLQVAPIALKTKVVRTEETVETPSVPLLGPSSTTAGSSSSNQSTVSGTTTSLYSGSTGTLTSESTTTVTVLPPGWAEDDDDYPGARSRIQAKAIKLDWARTAGHTTGTTFDPGATPPAAPQLSTYRYYPTNFRVAWGPSAGRGDYPEDDEAAVIAYAERYVGLTQDETPDRAIIQ
jgi:hypothetical protein